MRVSPLFLSFSRFLFGRSRFVLCNICVNYTGEILQFEFLNVRISVYKKHGRHAERWKDTMQAPRYIRHIHNRPRVAGADLSVFSSELGGAPYQDLVKFGTVAEAMTTEDDNGCLYTIGKCLLPTEFEGNTFHNRWTLLYVVEGMVTVNDLPLRSGDWVYIPAEYVHVLRAKSEKNPLYYWCTSNDSLLEATLAHVGFCDKIVSGSYASCETVAELFENAIYSTYRDRNFRVQFAGIEMSILSCFENIKFREHTTGEISFERCLQRIEYYGGRITVAGLARELFISRRQLFDIFMQQMNCSPQQFIYETRMHTAKRLIVQSKTGIARIAEYLGYSNYNHFSRAYKRFFGLTPREERKNAAMSMRGEESKEIRELLEHLMEVDASTEA